MEFLRALPLLERLSPMELAKILPDLQEFMLATGERLGSEEAGQRVLFVVEGSLAWTKGGSSWPSSHLGAGALLGEAALLGEEPETWQVEAMRPSHLVGIPASTFGTLLREHPTLLEEFNRRLLSRKAGVGPKEESATAAMEAAPVEALARLWLRPTSLVLATVLAGTTLLWPGAGKPWEARAILASLVWGAVCWLFQSLPDYLVALAASVAVAAVGAAAPDQAFSGFASPTWFLQLGVWVVGVAIARTGLLYRLALHMLLLLPSNYVGQSFALAITGTLLTPLIPSSQGRTVMAAPLTLELSDAMRLPPRSNGSAGLAMASFLGFGQMYYLALNGTTTGILAWSFLPDDIRAKASWLFWLIAALPLSAAIFGLTYWLTLRFFPDRNSTLVNRKTIERQLAMLGPMGGRESMSLLVTLLVLGGFVTNPLHGVDAAWFAMGGMFLLLATGVVDRDSLARDVDWSFMLFFGTTLGIANVTRGAQLDTSLAAFLQPLLAPALGHPVLAVGAVGLLTIVVRMALSHVQATPLLAITLIPVFAQAGLNAFGAVLAIMVASSTFIVPGLSPGYVAMLAGTREKMFSNRQIFWYAVCHSLILLLALILSAPYWRFLGAL
jgi:anion transporter